MQGDSDNSLGPTSRFPHFSSTPVSYLSVRMQDAFWAPRQRTIREVTIPWASRHLDDAGGLVEFKASPGTYRTQIRQGDWEANRFLQSMSSVVGLDRDRDIEALIEVWASKFIEGQEADGYLAFAWPMGADPQWRWKACWWSHEDMALGRYLEAAIAYREATGRTAMYNSAVRAADNMVATLLGSQRAYAPGHAEIEHALMRLYGVTGNSNYLHLCGWLIDQRGCHEGRPSFGKYAQDHLPLRAQRTIEGHAVRAAFLYNGVTEYVGATGDDGCREAILAVWDDFVNHKMYVHGAGGLRSTRNEGYSSEPDLISPDDCYGETCSVCGNFEWAHSLFRLTGDAVYVDVAERMLYNAFYASLSLRGDRYFYENGIEALTPTVRLAWHPVPCCVPNIVTLFAAVGGFFYSVDRGGVFVKHYGASVADIPFDGGVRLTQHTDYPWSGEITIDVVPTRATEFTLRLRVPAWARSYELRVNGKAEKAPKQQGWLAVHRPWKPGDQVHLSLPMAIERTTLPARFKAYEGLVALERGPILYCLEEQGIVLPMERLFLPPEGRIVAEHRHDLLGGVTVLRTHLKRVTDYYEGKEVSIDTQFVPYGVWGNREPGAMRVWLPQRRYTNDEVIRRIPERPYGEPS